jgi:hypothetical protein
MLGHRLRRGHGECRVDIAQFAVHRGQQIRCIQRRARDDRGRQGVGLREREIEHVRHRSEQAGADVARDANDLHPGARVPLQPEPATDRVCCAEVVSSHRLVDHGDARRVRTVASAERSATQEGDTQRLEEPRPGPEPAGVETRFPVARRPLHDDPLARHLHR